MTEREKIIKIIAPYVAAYGEDEAIADTLIKAGLVADVQSLADGDCVLYVKGRGFMRLYNEQDINKMIHRAEVAERQAVVLSKWLAEKTRKDYPWRAWFDAAQKQAEKNSWRRNGNERFCM